MPTLLKLKKNPDPKCDSLNKTTPKGTIEGVRSEEQVGCPHCSN